MRPIEKDADVYTLKEFIKMVEEGCFIDYDGFGRYATVTEESDEGICPSDITGRTQIFNEETEKMEMKEVPININRDYTHVVWYNR